MSDTEALPELPPMVRDSQLVPPPRKPSGRLGMETLQDYQDLYRKSLTSPGSYWVSVASELEWLSGWPPDVAMTGDLESGFQYFPGAYGNTSINCVDRHARENPQRTAIHWIGEDGSERHWTYGDLLEQTARFAQALTEMGVKKGDVVAILLPNLLETFATVHACYRIGAIYNIIFSGFSPQALADRIEDTGAKVVVTADEAFRRGNTISLKKNLDSVLSYLPTIEHVVVVRRSGSTDVPMSAPRDVYWDDLLERTTSLAEPVAMEANEPAFIIYTSGTSAKPKGLVHSGLGFLVGAYHNTKMAVDLCPEDVYWCTADTGWLTFPIFELVGATAMGATMLAYEGALDFPAPDRFYDIVERYRVNKVFTAPTLLRMLARYGVQWLEKHDISHLELISLVGEPLDAKTWHWTHDNVGQGNLEINNTYGQSETGSAWTSSIVGVTPAKPGSCGPALPGHSYTILDSDNNPAPRGQVGFLALDKPFPTLFRDIWRDHERYKTQYFTRLGPALYDTADAALEDEDGHVWVVGRVDGVINVAAHRLSTMEMESALLSMPGVAEAAVIGVADDTKGQVPVGFVTLAAGKDGSISEADLADRLVESIGPIARPKQIYLLSTMPRTRSGKIVRRLLQELVTTGTVEGDTTGLEDPEVLDKLKEELTVQR
ncbi:MAG: acetate--CoA ligase [Actinobacteria bacterium]|nr:acetate--CoA ligase [Actinomycetota bacterium]MCL5446000.1 acetate--CoA ligase [Actinomycetota bacterium]